MTGAAGGPHTVSCSQELIELRASNSQFMGKGALEMVELTRTISMSLSSIDLFGFVRSFVREPDKSAFPSSCAVADAKGLSYIKVVWLLLERYNRHINCGN